MVNSNYDDTSSALLVEERLLRMINGLVAGTVSPEVITGLIDTYVSTNGISATAYMYDRGGIAAASWIIEHNLNKYPQVTIMDDLGNQVEADIVYNNLNSVTITFAKPLSGRAILT